MIVSFEGTDLVAESITVIGALLFSMGLEQDENKSTIDKKPRFLKFIMGAKVIKSD
jgi:hypothetical protein